jgi:hypothetical protein
MSQARPMNDLAERKRLLTIEADLHRNLISVECARMRDRVKSLTSLGTLPKYLSFLAPTNPWVIGGTAIAGALAARNWGKAIKWLPAAFSLWRLLRKPARD